MINSFAITNSLIKNLISLAFQIKNQSLSHLHA